MSTADQPTAPSRGAALMVSYEELVRIRSGQVSIEAKLDAALALRGEVEKLDKRVTALEAGEAYAKGANSTRNTILAYAAGLVTTAIGGGALMYLPKLGAVLMHLPATH